MILLYIILFVILENMENIYLVRNDKITIEEINDFLKQGILEGIISPGPKVQKTVGYARKLY